MSGLINSANFIIKIVFDFYIYVLIVRLLLEIQHNHYYSPISQFIFKVTNPLVNPLQKVLPSYKGFSFAVLLLAIVIQLIEAILLFWLSASFIPGIYGTLIATCGILISKSINLFFVAIIAYVIMSWIPNLQRSPAAGVIESICTPILSPLRRIIPLLAGIDLTPFLAMILLQIITQLLANPLIAYGSRLALTL